MKPKVYIETTIASYQTAWKSPNLVMAANQETTRQWWSTRGPDFDFFISQVVVKEASAGDSDAARKRLELLQAIPRLEVSEEAENLADQLVADVLLPRKAQAYALHIAVAAVHGMEYLLTWNCTHIANAVLRPRIESICRRAGCEPPTICTPQELLEEGDANE